MWQRIEAGLDGLGYHGYTFQSSDAPVSATSGLVSAALGEVTFRYWWRVDGARPSFVTGGVLEDLRLVAFHSYPPRPIDLGPWKQDLEAVKQWCATGPKTVIAGDFNATMDHAALSEALGDSCRGIAPSVGEGLQGNLAVGPARHRQNTDRPRDCVGRA